MKKWQKIALIGCSTCLVLAICAGITSLFVLRHIGRAFMASGENIDETKQSWTECAVPHPGGAPALTFMQRSIHPFLAEYEYKLRFGTGTNAVERWLRLNCGGRTRMNAYWYPSEVTLGPTIRLQDHWREYLLRMQEQKTYLILRYKGRVFAGEITVRSPGASIAETHPPGGESEIHVSVGDSQAEDITDTNVGRCSGEYFGRIDGQRYPVRFVPVSETPELGIEMVR
jgi:hypothetical protein